MKITISSKPDSLKQYVSKIWSHKSVILTLAKRDLKIKYAQTSIGLAWTILQPLVAVTVYTFFFSVVLSFDSKYPYILFVLSGVLFWGLFNYIFTHASTSILQNQDLIRKMYFPKIILPISKILVGLFEFFVISILFVLLLWVFKIPLSYKVLFTIPLILLVVLFSLGISFIVCASTVYNRDLYHIVPFLVNFGIWFTPVFYPVNILSGSLSNLIFLNPMASLIQIFRHVIFGDIFSPIMLVGIPIAILVFLVGFFYFKRMEDIFSDAI